MKFDIKYILIIILIVIIILMRGCDSKSFIKEPIVITKYDTIWKKTHDTIIKKINITNIKYIPVKGPIYFPTDNIDTCKTRFNLLLKEYSEQTTYKDSIKLDSIGFITVIDTVWKNKLKERVYIRNYKIPFVTKTVTVIKQEEPKKQLYIGGNLFGDKTKLQLIAPGILYKNKKDNIYQVNLGVNFDGSITYGAGMYWKIKLNNK
jgi:hypothetical protein